jgi:hypothetical protein
MAAFGNEGEGIERGEMQQVQHYEDNWLADSSDEEADDHLDHNNHQHDDADTDQQSVSQYGNFNRRKYDSESVAVVVDMYQAGYRDGAGKGNEAAFQKRFDAGFSRGMIIGRLIGELWLEIQLALKNLPQLPVQTVEVPSSSGLNISNPSEDTIRLENALLRNQSQKALKILFVDLPELLADVSPSAIQATATNAEVGNHENAEFQISAELAAAIPEEEIRSEHFDLQSIVQEKAKIRSVLDSLRNELRHFPAPVLLVLEDLASQF